jgi:hypothetical protein
VTSSLIYILDFFLLALVSYAIRKRNLRDVYSATAAGAIVMAGSLFAASIMPHLAKEAALFIPYVTLELLIVWLFIAESLVRSYMEHHFYIHTRNPLNHFNIGTWVTATAMLGYLWLQVFNGLDIVAWLLALIAISVWIEYIRMMMNDLTTITENHLAFKLNGSIFLLVLSTESLALLLNAILGSAFPVPIFFIFISLGYVFFAACCILLTRYYLQIGKHQAGVEGYATNCMLHGALAILGMTAVKAEIIPLNIILITWVLTALAFFVLEGWVLLRAIVRLVKKRRQAFSWHYDVMQWMRIFTYELFYVFSGMIAARQYQVLQPLTQLILHYLQYLVAALVLLELVLFFHAKYKPVLIATPLDYKDVKK